MMQLTVKTTQPLKQQKNACLIVGIFLDGTLTTTAKIIDQHSDGTITKLLKQHHFKADIGQTLPIFHYQASDQILLLVGCGDAKMTAFHYRKIVFCAMQALIRLSIQYAVCYLAELNVEQYGIDWKIKQMTEAAFEACYRFDLFKSKKEPAIRLKQLLFHLADIKEQKIAEKALKQGEAIAECVSFTKNLANLPSNICTPTLLAEQAKMLSKMHPALRVEILNEKAMQKLRMGAMLAVSQGSAEEAKLICLRYHGGKAKAAPIVLIGKGVTFDTGGNSLKSPDNMVGMKYDMCGAATVLGILKAAALLKLPHNIVGIIPAVENMPGGTAYKPEDIITSMSGQTVEVISTDAEGRLILADALTYAERYQPRVVIDIATLTGAVVIALGFHTTGLVSNNEPLAQALLKAGRESNDLAWQLPLFDVYQDQIKSPFADMANTGGRSAGVITAACFLSRFAKKFPWAHLDVAGTAAMMMGTNERMATGRPLPLIVQYLIDQTL